MSEMIGDDVKLVMIFIAFQTSEVGLRRKRDLQEEMERER